MSEAAVQRRAFAICYGLIALFLVMLTTVDALSIGQDQRGLPGWTPYVWEYSSGVVILALVPALRRLLTYAPPRAGGEVRFAVAAGLGFLGFSLIHVGGFTVLRALIYRVVGASYRPGDFLYECRKDVVTYVSLLAVLWLTGQAARLWAAAHAGAHPAAAAGAAPLLNLRDGATSLRVPAGDIIAARSARNYVEYHLKDGRRPLIRETLASAEADLALLGFLRTHRSWIVNPAHVRAVTPASAGDFRLDLDGGLEAPLSRRFPDALKVLRPQTPRR